MFYRTASKLTSQAPPQYNFSAGPLVRAKTARLGASIHLQVAFKKPATAREGGGKSNQLAKNAALRQDAAARPFKAATCVAVGVGGLRRPQGRISWKGLGRRLFQLSRANPPSLCFSKTRRLENEGPRNFFDHLVEITLPTALWLTRRNNSSAIHSKPVSSSFSESPDPLPGWSARCVGRGLMIASLATFPARRSN